MTNSAKARQETCALLFTVRNLVDAIWWRVDNFDDEREERFTIQCLAKIAMEKIDEATGRAILNPQMTPKQIARARASIEKTGGFVKKSKPCDPEAA